MIAKVFLSCGQSKGTEEPEIAEKVAARLRELGFDCYVAVVDQSLVGLRENIFRQLETAEYFIFIDFRREKLKRGWFSDAGHRGSLFSHQELAIASYLEIPCLILQETGVKPLDGMLSCLQANAQQFSDRAWLPNGVADLVVQKIAKGEWGTSWKSCLSLHLPKKVYSDAHDLGKGLTFRFAHIEVKNNHRTKVAHSCYVVLEAIKNAATGEEIPVQTIEFKWAGSTLANVFIAPNASRRFDAFKIPHQRPSEVLFNIFCDSTEFCPRIPGLGVFFITYGVYSANFPVERRMFRLNHSGILDTASLEES